MTTDNSPIDGGSRPHYLRISIEVRARSASVVSIAIAEGVPAQSVAAGHPLLAVVDVPGQKRHVTRFPDPFEQRSTRAPDGGNHHLSRHRSGVVVVSVPFGSLTDLTRSRIDLVDVAGLGAVTPERLIEEVGTRRSKGRLVRSIGYADIIASPAWAKLAPTLGDHSPSAHFEIYTDKANRYRWRLRTTSHSIVAVSGEGFDTRAQCETDLRWLRQHAATAPIQSLDMPRPVS